MVADPRMKCGKATPAAGAEIYVAGAGDPATETGAELTRSA